MARLLRITYEAAVGHATAGDDECRAIFQDDADREPFLRGVSTSGIAR
jgi:hypothetical protein